MNIILGSGLVGMLARDILGDDWTIIPIAKSRYYTFNPPIADNFVIKDSEIDEYMRPYFVVPLLYKLGYSLGSQVLFNSTIPLPLWLSKVYGIHVPPHTQAYWSARSDFFGYGDCVNMYRILHDKYKTELHENNSKYGQSIKIAGHNILMNGKTIEYNKMVSTVPLPNLLSMLGIDWIDLPSRNLYCYHIRTNDLDLEKCDVVFVADPEIIFHKVIVLDKHNFIFFAPEAIEYPGRYFMKFMKQFDLIAETIVENSIQCGPIPNIPELADNSIIPMGSSVWDDCLDIGSNIKRLIKMR